jgi:hypothetical protein
MCHLSPGSEKGPGNIPRQDGRRDMRSVPSRARGSPLFPGEKKGVGRSISSGPSLPPVPQSERNGAGADVDGTPEKKNEGADHLRSNGDEGVSDLYDRPPHGVGSSALSSFRRYRGDILGWKDGVSHLPRSARGNYNKRKRKHTLRERIFAGSLRDLSCRCVHALPQGRIRGACPEIPRTPEKNRMMRP